MKLLETLLPTGFSVLTKTVVSGNCMLRRAGYLSPAPMLYLEEDQISTGMKKKTSNYHLQQPQQPRYYLNLCLCFLNFVFQLFCPCQARSTLEPCRPRASFYISHFHFFSSFFLRHDYFAHYSWFSPLCMKPC